MSATMEGMVQIKVLKGTVVWGRTNSAKVGDPPSWMAVADAQALVRDGIVAIVADFADTEAAPLPAAKPHRKAKG